VTLRVLIVDDHAKFRRRARRLLELEGFEVVGEAADGASALSAAHELRPDVVLLDLQLPDANGFDVAPEVIEAVDPSPVVVLTSTRDGADFDTLVTRSGAAGFVHKSELTGAALAELAQRR
jgi:DNA-binding NarL/FixJ family response regulator